MSLSKKICKRCCNKDGRAKWNKKDEAQWKEGSVLCPAMPSFKTALVAFEPPEHCPYIVEHAVNELKQKDMQTVH